MRPKVKICGITNLADAETAIRAGADFLGLNFYEESPRELTPDAAAHLSLDIKTQFPKTKLVGIFVDEPPSKIHLIADICDLDVLQLHGNQSPDCCTQFGIPVWRAFRIKDKTSLKNLDQFLDLQGIVLDTFKKGTFGGTGHSFDWKLAKHARKKIPLLVLAGGITTSNIQKAVKELQPEVIDVCSGVEVDGNPQKKDPTKIAKLFEELDKLS